MNIIESEAWAAYCEMRKAKGKRAPFTPLAQKILLRKVTALQAQGEDPIALLEAAAVAGWSSVYPTKGPEGAQAKSFRQQDRDSAAARMAELTGGTVSARRTLAAAEVDLFGHVPRLEQ